MSIYKYYSYKTQNISCIKKRCGWSGLGSETMLGESFEGLFEIDCPKCGSKVGIVPYPSFEEVLEHGTPEDKANVLKRKQFIEKMKTSKLKSADQLPNLNDDFIAFILKETKEDNEDYIIITHETNVIWKEIGGYEYYKRFIEIGKLFKEKYGERMIDLVPDVNGMWLWGDKIQAPEIIRDFRKTLNQPKQNKSVRSESKAIKNKVVRKQK